MPEHRRKYRFNSLLNWKVGQMIKCGMVFKVLHADPDFSTNFGSILDTDITPFMIYSLNKQKRWEISADRSFLELLQKLNQNLEIMVFERVSMRAWIDNWNNFPPHFITAEQDSKIKRSYSISKDGQYEEANFGGVGRFYGHPTTKKVSRTPTTMEVVSYNIVREPRNWKKVYTKDFKKWPWNRHDPTYHRKSKYDPKSLKWEIEEIYSDFEEEDLDSLGNSTRQMRFYNFMDHFVITKPKKRNKIINF